MKFSKIIVKEKTLASMVAINAKMHYLSSYKTDLAKLICADFGKSEFFNIYIFNWYKTPYSACSSNFQHLDFIRPLQMILCCFKHGGFLKPGSYDTPSSLRQNKLRIKI